MHVVAICDIVLCDDCAYHPVQRLWKMFLGFYPLAGSITAFNIQILIA